VTNDPNETNCVNVGTNGNPSGYGNCQGSQVTKCTVATQATDCASVQSGFYCNGSTCQCSGLTTCNSTSTNLDGAVLDCGCIPDGCDHVQACLTGPKACANPVNAHNTSGGGCVTIGDGTSWTCDTTLHKCHCKNARSACPTSMSGQYYDGCYYVTCTAGAVAFQQGVNGYAGTLDATIANVQWENSKGGAGIYCNVNTTYNDINKGLIKFDLSSIPTNKTVTAASLTLTFWTDWNSGITLKGSYLASSWDYNSSSLGWTYRTDTLTWAQAGIGGSDLVANKSFTISGLQATGDPQTLSVSLDVAQVQSWVTTPSTNQGILIEDQVNNEKVMIYSAENAAASMRPTLTVTYQ
jgi:hypothetical protein